MEENREAKPMGFQRKVIFGDKDMRFVVISACRTGYQGRWRSMKSVTINGPIRGDFLCFQNLIGCHRGIEKAYEEINVVRIAYSKKIKRRAFKYQLCYQY